MKDIIYKKFPIISERLCIKKITVDQLILIRSETKYEDEYRMTCRLIIKREENELQTASFNEDSINLLKKMNFKKDGILRNHHELDAKLYDDYIFSVLCKEWKFH